jgi:hypothetical protein
VPLLELSPAAMPDEAWPLVALALDMPTPAMPPMPTPVDSALVVPFWLVPTAEPVTPLLLLSAFAVPPFAATEPEVVPLTEPAPSWVAGPDPDALTAPEPWPPTAFAEPEPPGAEEAAPLVALEPVAAAAEPLAEPTVPSPAGAPTLPPPETEPAVPEPVFPVLALLDGPELLLDPAAALDPVPTLPCAPALAPRPPAVLPEPEAPRDPAPFEPAPEALFELEPAEVFELELDPGPSDADPEAVPPMPLALPAARTLPFAPLPFALDPAPLTPAEDEPLSPSPTDPWVPLLVPTDAEPMLPEELRPAVLADWPAALDCPASEAPVTSGAPVRRMMPSAPMAAISTALRVARACTERRRWRPDPRGGLGRAWEWGE